MIFIKFKNLEKSELAKEITIERINTLVDKFDDLQNSKISVTLEMENSPLKRGADMFGVKLFISTGKYKGISVKKSSTSLYKALADLVDHLLEVLNRAGDRKRLVERKKSRSRLDKLSHSR